MCYWTREAARSQQVLTCTMRSVVFIMIVGTNITANGVFHCGHFQAPAMSLHRDRRGESWRAKSSQDEMESLDGGGSEGGTEQMQGNDARRQGGAIGGRRL